MNHIEIQTMYNEICNSIYAGELSLSITQLKIFANQTKKQYHQNQLDILEETYSNILKHSFKNISDPERDSIYQRLQRSLLEITDTIKECLLTEISGLIIYKMKWSLDKKRESQTDDALSLISHLTFDSELDKILKENDINISDSDNSTISRSQALRDLFNYLWLTDKYTETESKLLETICLSEKIPWHDKSLLTSAITLSLLRIFDKNKFFALQRFYYQNEDQVWERALIGLLLGLYKYNKRLEFYPDLVKMIDKVANTHDIDKQTEAIIIQIFKSKDTERIIKKWDEEILPEMMKMQPLIEKKLDLENIVPDKFFEDKNPDWEQVFEDSPGLLDKLQDFSKLQIEGGDVFMSAFSRLKHFPFFNEISNWFLPFYKENEMIDSHIQQKETNLLPFIEQLQKSHYMCNSDKYSFCLNLQFIPDSHKTMMMEMFNEEMKNIDEISKDEKLVNSFAVSKSIITQYTQDLYRFYKLYQYKHEFSDIFTWKFDIQNTFFFKRLLHNTNVTRNLAEFFLENKHFEQAAELFSVLENNEISDIELFEKIGYCYQQTGNYQKALEYYKKAELFDSKKSWIIKKIALCYRYLNNPEKALEYYLEAEKKEPENLYILAYIGHTMVRLNRFDDALKYYFKVEYLSPANDKIQRPIAWISFTLGKFDQAQKYYSKIIGYNKNEFDLIHLGHVYWCLKEQDKAINSYLEALKLLKTDFQLFFNAFNDDIDYLVKFGINNIDISLMKDFLLQNNLQQ
ncbi:MAG: tetratricopeptide repeat protein [Bacteroidales bacterium]|jgi:tetratricopeptide (TPR) repeat protein|nr:tetratricopeptide repeat protein [Bacteroidales bacterium]